MRGLEPRQPTWKDGALTGSDTRITNKQTQIVKKRSTPIHMLVLRFGTIWEVHLRFCLRRCTEDFVLRYYLTYNIPRGDITIYRELSE